jgi:hypothetical protein
LEKRIAMLQQDWPGVALVEQTGRFRLAIPERFRVGHEEHFAQVAQRFLEYVRNPPTLPAWEKTNLLATYTVTTKGVQLARQTMAAP